MKETIYTIPLNEAFDTDCECAVCEFMRKEEINLVNSTMGASMMEPEFREITNRMGFCKIHQKMVLNTESKLSVALVYHTHMTQMMDTLANISKSAEGNTKKSLFKKSDFRQSLEEELDKLHITNSSCAICKRLSETEERFLNNLIYLYKKEKDFKEKVLNSKGFCLVHYKALLSCAMNSMSDGELMEFVKDISDVQNKNFKRLTDEVEYFSSLFDYKNKGKDPKESRTALSRSSEKLISYIN